MLTSFKELAEAFNRSRSQTLTINEIHVKKYESKLQKYFTTQYTSFLEKMFATSMKKTENYNSSLILNKQSSSVQYDKRTNRELPW